MFRDNDPGIRRGYGRADGMAAFMGTLATRLVPLPAKDPECKGIVERRNHRFHLPRHARGRPSHRARDRWSPRNSRRTLSPWNSTDSSEPVSEAGRTADPRYFAEGPNLSIPT